MRLRDLFVVTAVAEIVTGLGLLGLPGIVVAVLLGIRSAPVETLFIGRIAGAALVAIGVACALARDDDGTAAQRGLLVGILLYNVLVALLLGYAGFVLQLAGPALWPVAILHALLAIWCIVCLRV